MKDEENEYTILAIIMSAICTLLLITHNVHAQYSPNQTINFIMDVSDSLGTPISSATCNGYVYDSSMNLVNTLPLSYNLTTKIYYSPFTTGNEGQYIEVGECTVNAINLRTTKMMTVTGTSDINEKLTSINNTIKNEISNLDTNIYNNFTSLGNQTTYWGSLNVNTTTTYGNMIYNFLQNLSVGNVTVNATVDFDYDTMAIYVLSYLKGAKVWCWWLKC